MSSVLSVIGPESGYSNSKERCPVDPLISGISSSTAYMDLCYGLYDTSERYHKISGYHIVWASAFLRNEKSSFWNAQFVGITPKVVGVVAELNRLLPNFSSLEYRLSRLYINVIQSMVLYGVPIWSRYVKKEEAKILNRIKRLLS